VPQTAQIKQLLLIPGWT